MRIVNNGNQWLIQSHNILYYIHVACASSQFNCFWLDYIISSALITSYVIANDCVRMIVYVIVNDWLRILIVSCMSTFATHPSQTRQLSIRAIGASYYVST